MARTKPTQITEEVTHDHIAEAVDELEQNILAALNATSDDVHFKLSVCKVDQNNSREGRIGVYPPTDNMDPLLDEIAAKYGSGTYRFRLYRNGVISMQTDRDLIAPPVAVAPAPQTTDVAAAIASALAKPMELLTQLVTQQQQPRGRETPITELVQALGTLDNLRGGGRQPEASIGPEKVMEFVKMGIEFAQDGGGTRGNTSFMDLFGKIIEKMDWAELAKSITPHTPIVVQQQPQTMIAPASPMSRADAPPVPPASNGAEPTPEQRLQVMLQHNLRYLCQKAAANADIELYAEWCYDNIPTDVLTALMNTPDVVGMLQSIAPEVGAHATWFMGLAEQVRAILTDEAQGEDSNQTPKGAPPNVHGPSVANPPRSE